MTLDSLAGWSKIKGISLIATGDFTHPEWLFLCKQKLESTGNGFYKLKKIIPDQNEFIRSFQTAPEDTSFILSTEVSLIYSKKGKVRKIHLLVLAPDFDAVDKLNSRLSGLGNLRSDGRPILGYDARDFLKLVVRHAPECRVIPAHIWTPWFSLFGANSGFETIEECFEEMTPHIFALETGLSSDPPMNRRLSALDKYTLISNSDAHSPSRIGREANVFNTEFSFQGLMDALKKKNEDRILYTVEFFPEEGKYHYDGHRKCGVLLSPKDTIRHNSICPECGKKVTIGVLHRVQELADREPDEVPSGITPYKNLIPLNEIIAQAMGKTPECRSVWECYFRFIREFGNEHTILTEIPVEQLSQISPDRVSLGIAHMRHGRVNIQPGHDGAYGTISLFEEEEMDAGGLGQLTLF